MQYTGCSVTTSDWPTKSLFAKNSGSIKSVRNASEAFKLYFAASIMDAIVTETNWYVENFRHTQG
jgi:hypothetical protein